MAIKIIEEDSSRKRIIPYWRLDFNYMIGDANGYTKQKINVFCNNPYVERFVKLLRSLGPVKGTWGIVFEQDRLIEHFEEGQITENDYKFLNFCMFFEDCDDEIGYFETKKEIDFAGEFYRGIKGQTAYSFLVFQGVDLFYFDEYGKKHSTEIV